MRTRTLTAFALAVLSAGSCKDDSSSIAADNLIPAGEPNVYAMSLMIGGSQLYVSKRGVVDGIVVIRPGASDVSAEFFREDGSLDPIVTRDAFRLDISVNNSDTTVRFVRSDTDPFAGTLTASGVTLFTSVHVTLFHVTKNHNDWLTDFSQVFVRN